MAITVSKAMSSIPISWRRFGAPLAVLLVAACSGEIRPDADAAGLPVLRSGYACCNLHYEGDWVSDANYSQFPFIPAGTPIKVRSISGHRAGVEVDGKPMRFGLDYGRVQDTTETWVERIVVLDDPKARIAQFPLPVQAAIESGRVMVGMTKEQVIISLGYPQTEANPTMNAPFWRYWWSSFVPYSVHWTDGRVSKIDSNHEAVNAMTYTGP